MPVFKYFITLRYKGCEASRYEWAHNPIQALGLAIANYGASLSVPDWEGIEIVSVTIPPEDIERAEAALLGRIEERLSRLTPEAQLKRCACDPGASCPACALGL